MEIRTTKGRLFLFLLIILLIPLLEHKIVFFHSKPLYKVEAIPNVKFNFKIWWNDSFQTKKGAFINDNIGFRPELVRSTNQLDFWLFKKAQPYYIVVGKENYLYQVDYIQAYTGDKYNGENIVRSELVKLKFLQDTLSKLNKLLVLVYAPSKAWYYPEYFPYYLSKKQIHDNVYDDYVRIGDSLGITAIDFNRWFVLMKGTTKHLLFTKQGIHWTKFGAFLAADSLIKYISRAEKVNLPSLVLDSIIETDTPQSSETDLAKLLNLYFPIAKEKFSYPIYHYSNAPQSHLETIYIGDSFFWTLNEIELPEKTNKYWEFWYYFKDVWTQQKIVQIWQERKKNVSPEQISNYNWKEKLDHADCVVILNSGMNLLRPGNGFIDSAYNHFCPNGDLKTDF